MYVTIPVVALGDTWVMMWSAALTRRTCDQCPITLFYNHICIYTISKDLNVNQMQLIYCIGHQDPITAIRLNTNDFCLLFLFNSNIFLLKAGCL